MGEYRHAQPPKVTVPKEITEDIIACGHSYKNANKWEKKVYAWLEENNILNSSVVDVFIDSVVQNDTPDIFVKFLKEHGHEHWGNDTGFTGE